MRRRCASCGCCYRVSPAWEHIGSGVFGIVCGGVILLAMSHMLPWSLAIILVLLLGFIGYILFPYVTPFALVEDEEEHGHTSA